MTWELIVVLVGVVSGIYGVISGIRGSRRDDERRTRDDALLLARIEGKLDSANRGIEDMRVEVRAHGSRIAELSTRITRCEESTKSAHHRLDEIKGADQ